jgi:cation diffusion facilitator CzcD-associated flavoprotein CzcO
MNRLRDSIGYIWFLVRFLFESLAPTFLLRLIHRPSSVTPAAEDSSVIDVLIIGGGISGICAAIELRRRLRGVRVQIVERAADLGGVWLTNTYPGCACDIPSALYSFSFAPNPDWTRQWPSQRELLDYVQSTARQYGLYERGVVRFRTNLVATRWDDRAKLWRSTLRGEDDQSSVVVVESRFVVSCVGQLSEALWPDIQNLDRLDRPLVHSAHWPPGQPDIAGKRVAVIGAGASAIQIVPAIVDRAQHVYVFQSTPSWILPKDDHFIPPWLRTVFRVVPLTLQLYRFIVYLSGEVGFVFGFSRSSTLRERLLRVFDKMRAPLTASLSPELLAKTTPQSPFGCRRTLFTSDWFAALARPNVTLLDERVSEARAGAVRGERSGTWVDVDVVCCATGFHATEFLRSFEVYGRDNRSLKAHWRENGTSAYLSLAVPQFPNFFMTYGPNSNLGFNSIIMMVEAQMRQIGSVIEHAVTNRFGAVEPTDAAAAEWRNEVTGELAKLVFTANCNSWYRTESGEIPTNSPFSVLEFFRRTWDLDTSKWRWTN